MNSGRARPTVMEDPPDGSDDDTCDVTVNPAPPPGAGELIAVLHSDAIGDTLFSERGVLRTLMALNAAVPRYLGLGEAEAGRGDGEGGVTAGESVEQEAGRRSGVEDTSKLADSGKPAANGAETSGSDMDQEVELALMELDPELEEQLCQLWDMAAERDVAAFLGRSGLVDVAWPLLGRSPCPRLLEIIAGTLANCAGHGAGALPGGAATAADIVARLIANSRGDAPVLREALRLAQAAVRTQPEPATLLRVLNGWLPLLGEVLLGALLAPLLRQALGLIVAVAALPGRRDWWVAEVAAVPQMSAALVEGMAQLVAGGGALPAEEVLDCCRDALLLLAEVEASEGAAHDGSDGWLAPVNGLVRGVAGAWRAADNPADPRLACCLLWLAARSLRREFCTDTLSALLRYCRAALAGQAGPGDGGAEPATGSPQLDVKRGADRRGDAPEDEAATLGESPDEAEMQNEVAEERAELAARLGATAAHLARHCAAVPRFLAAADPRDARLFGAALERADPCLARQLRLHATEAREAGTHRL